MASSRSKSKLLRRFSTLYLLLMAIPILMGIITVFVTSHVFLENLLASNARQLSSGGEMMDDALIAVDEFSQAISKNEEFIRLVRHRQSAYSVCQFANTLLPLHTPNSVIDRYFFYCCQEQLRFIIGPRITYVLPDLYYRSCFRYGDMTAQEFWAFLSNGKGKQIHPAQDVVYMNVPSRALLMTVPLSENSYRVLGHMFFYFSEEKILKLFQPLQESGAAYLGVYGPEGTLLLSDGMEAPLSRDTLQTLSAREGRQNIALPDGGYALLYFRAPESGWLFTALIPHDVFIAQNTQVMWVVILAVLAFILLAILLFCMIAHYNQKPLAQLVEILPIDEHAGSRGLWPVQRAVEKLTLNNEELNERLSTQQVQLRDASIAQLVKGNFENEEEMALLLSHTGVELPGPAYQGIYMQVLNQLAPSEANMEYIHIRHTVLAEAVKPYEPSLQLLTLKDSNEYILLYSGARGRPLEEIVSAVYTTLKGTFNLNTAFFVGIPCQNLRTLNQSFSLAHALALNGADEEHYLQVAERKPLNTAVYDYTASDEIALLAHAQRNELDKVNAVLQDIYGRNFVQRSLTPFMQQSLYNAMLHTLCKSDCPMNLPRELTNIPLNLKPEAFVQALATQYQAMCDWIQDNRRRDSRLMMEKVIHFVSENFNDSDMSLTRMATQFGLTEEYLSKSFKRWSEMNFSTYLENMRIHRARELLRSTDKSMQDISESVGYTNARSFRRAYGRVLGHPPSDDRGDAEESHPRFPIRINPKNERGNSN